MPTTETASSSAPASALRQLVALAVTAASVALAVAGLAAVPAVAAPSEERRWELITPPDRNERTAIFVFAATSTGDRVAYATNGSLPGAESGSAKAPNLAERNADGWSSAPVDFPYVVPSGAFRFVLPVAANAGMSYWAWQSGLPLLPGAPSDPALGLYSSGVGGPPTLLAGGLDLKPAGGSGDARTIAFDTSTALLPADVRTSGRQAYEHGPAGLRLVGVDGAGAPLSPCGATVGVDRPTDFDRDYQPNAVSRDGRRIFVSSPDADGCGTSRRVYLRENGATTTEISASRCTRADCNGPRPVFFMGATPSGATAYLATDQQLTDDDLDGSRDLYRYDVASGALSRISAGPPGAAAAVVPTHVLPSDDGSRVYFLAGGALAPGAGGAGSKIYVADGHGLRLVAPLAADDPWTTPSPTREGAEIVQTTSGGQRLLFTSTAQLTADDLDASRDVYLYDAEEAALTRVSGSGGGGNGAFDADYRQAPFGEQDAILQRPRRSIADDGRRVFFATAESLVAADANTTRDVYEWEAGDLRLVTSGALGAGSVEYRTASADGRSVFFVTDESLVAADDDLGDVDLYVAREGGGFAEREGGGTDPCAPRPCGEPPIERVERAAPASVRFGQARAARLRVLPVSDRARRRAAGGGQLTLRVRTDAPGRVTARALTSAGRRTRVVARAHADARRAGTLRLRLRLSRPARRLLRDAGALSLRVVVRQRPDRSAVVRLTLEAPR
jgi:hypothetical protein